MKLLTLFVFLIFFITCSVKADPEGCGGASELYFYLVNPLIAPETFSVYEFPSMDFVGSGSIKKESICWHFAIDVDKNASGENIVQCEEEKEYFLVIGNYSYYIKTGIDACDYDGDGDGQPDGCPNGYSNQDIDITIDLTDGFVEYEPTGPPLDILDHRVGF